MILTVQNSHASSWHCSFWRVTAHLPWNLINWWEVSHHHSCSVANAVTPSPHAETKDHCTMPALYPAAGAKIVTVISRMKNLRSCCGIKKKKPHRSLSSKQGTTAFIFACCSRLQKVCFRPGPGYKIKESAEKKELNPIISLLSHVPERKTLNKQPCTSECGSCMLLFSRGVISKSWVSSHCSAHNCFYPLENNLVRSRIKLICEQCLPFFLATKQTTN